MVTAAMCARGRTLAEPRLSPDGSTLAFVASLGARAQLVTVPAEGGPELGVGAYWRGVPVGLRGETAACDR